MTLLQILVFVLVAALSATLRRGRGWILMVASILAIYWMQPATPIRNLDFWLPTATLGLAVLVWAATRGRHAGQANHEKDANSTGSEDWLGLGILGSIIFLIGLTRYFSPLCCLTPTPPPVISRVLMALACLTVIGLVIARGFATRPRLGEILVILILGLFLVLKTAPWAQAASTVLRHLTGQPTGLASALDIRWLGFSYVAFRLIHTLRDRIAGRLPGLALREYVTYVVFFPSFTAGPIDRVQRFAQDLRKPFALSAVEAFEGGERIVLGIFKKFVLADGLALMALSGGNAPLVISSGWMWVLLYAYSFRLFFDFSGYTDIAIGIGRLAGVRLPENFDRPYLKPNLTQFWNSWHITLAQWFRAYFFNPLTRALRSNPRALPMPLIILVGQMGTMLLIGLWHGVTWNFVAWGAWHGIGLFANNRWTEATKARLVSSSERPWRQRALTVAGVLLTFHYVTLGWVWFALPSMSLSWQVFIKLFGR